VYENPAPVIRGGQDVTDARNVSVRVLHSLIQMPADGYQVRFDDPRVGYFTESVTDLTSASVTPYRDLINRWDLRKKDPSAALSEPVEPIVWWIENTTPVELRPAIKEGVLRWNEAFEQAGFKERDRGARAAGHRQLGCRRPPLQRAPLDLVAQSPVRRLRPQRREPADGQVLARTSCSSTST